VVVINVKRTLATGFIRSADSAYATLRLKHGVVLFNSDAVGAKQPGGPLLLQQALPVVAVVGAIGGPYLFTVRGSPSAEVFVARFPGPIPLLTPLGGESFLIRLVVLALVLGPIPAHIPDAR
jgi:hypothetical protein